MYFWSSFLVVLLVFSIDFGSNVDAVYRKKDPPCKVNHTICAFCESINKTYTLYPSCTSPIRINNQCGELGPCSLQLTGTCKTDGDCTPGKPSCLDCVRYKAPFCTQARCFNKKCALIKPCTISLQH